MSIAYTRFKMNLTTRFVDHARSFCDGCNIVINAVATPFQRLKNRVMLETPWVIVVFAAVFAGGIPLVGYPYLKPLLMTDRRRETEEERVRLCLQKGIDPYPYMRAKEFVYGNSVTSLSWEGQTPDDCAPEYQVVDAFEQRREKLAEEVNMNIETSVQCLLALREEQKELLKKKTGLATEPKSLIFKGRDDVNVLKS